MGFMTSLQPLQLNVYLQVVHSLLVNFSVCVSTVHCTVLYCNKSSTSVVTVSLN